MPQDLQSLLLHRQPTVTGEVQYPKPGDPGVQDDRVMRGLMVGLGLEQQAPGDAAGAIGAMAGMALPAGLGKLLKFAPKAGAVKTGVGALEHPPMPHEFHPAPQTNELANISRDEIDKLIHLGAPRPHLETPGVPPATPPVQAPPQGEQSSQKLMRIMQERAQMKQAGNPMPRVPSAPPVDLPSAGPSGPRLAASNDQQAPRQPNMPPEQMHQMLEQAMRQQKGMAPPTGIQQPPQPPSPPVKSSFNKPGPIPSKPVEDMFNEKWQPGNIYSPIPDHLENVFPKKSGGMAAIPPAEARERARLMKDMLESEYVKDPSLERDKAVPEGVVAAANELYKRAPRVMGHIEKIRWGKDAEKTGVARYLGTQQNLNDDVYQYPTHNLKQMFEATPEGDYMSAVNLNTSIGKRPDQMESTMVHEGAHVAQQIRRGPKFVPEYQNEMPKGYSENKFEKGAFKTQRKTEESPTDSRNDRLFKRIFENQIPPDSNKWSSEARSLYQDMLRNMLKEYKDPQSAWRGLKSLTGREYSPEEVSEIKRNIIAQADKYKKR